MSETQVEQWRCFHCDEVFTDEAEALLHFGPTEDWQPICAEQIPVEFRKLQIENTSLQNKVANQEDKLDGLEAHFDELKRYFGPDCTSVWAAGDRFSNVKFELKMAREELAAAKAELEQVRGMGKVVTGDMFWDADDPEMSEIDPDEILIEHYGPNEVVRLQQANRGADFWGFYRGGGFGTDSEPECFYFATKEEAVIALPALPAAEEK